MANRFLHFLKSLTSIQISLIVFFLAITVYANTFNNGLFFDDEHFIYNNNSVVNFDIPHMFSHSLTEGAGKISNYYRPILFIGFAIEYSLFEDNGFIYHTTSTVIHGLSGVLVFLLLYKVFRNKKISFLTATLFVIHPIQTEAIAYASGRGDPLSLTFSLLTIYLSLFDKKYLKICSMFFLILALLSKELSLITPGLLFISHLFYNSSFSRKGVLTILKTSIPYIFISLFYFFLRLTVLNFADTLNFYQSQTAYTANIFIRLNQFLHLVPDYLTLLIFPQDLFIERDLAIMPVFTPTIKSMSSLLGILGMTVLSFKIKKTFPFLLFGILWMTISFIPTTGIIPINGIFYEHFLYFPSIGFFLIVSSVIFMLLKNKGNNIQLIGLILITIMIFTLCARTILRNNDWEDAITFYNQTATYVKSARIYNNLGMAYSEKNMDQHAIKAYYNAISIADIYPETHYNLGNLYLQSNNLESAIAQYNQSLKINPTFYLSHIKLYQIYSLQNNIEGKDSIEKKLRTLGEQNPEYIKLLEELKK